MSNVSNEREILKTLLLKEELELLNKLQEKLLSKKQFTKEVSDVLAGAINRAQNKDKSLSLALSAPIKDGVEKAFTENRQSIIDALLPIMGQLIRKTVTNSIKQFVSDINRKIELGYSIKALKWRWQAYKTGTDFAEILFQKTINYQVQELFLVNTENGLLIEHAGADDMLKDNDAISGMLTAIQDFIGDSLQTPDSGLLSAEIDDKLILISKGPTAFLASVIKGSPTERLKERFQQLIENIHADFSKDLTMSQTYRNNSQLNDYLRKHLIIKNIDGGEEKKINWIPWVVGLVLLISSIAYFTHKRASEFTSAKNLVQSVDGFYLQSFKRGGDGFIAEGLLDPLANTNKLKNNHISLKSKPFISLDAEIIKQRVREISVKYPKITTQISGSTLKLSGVVSLNESKEIQQAFSKIIGITTVKPDLTIDKNSEVNQFLKSHKGLLKPLKAVFSNNTLKLSGATNYQSLKAFENSFTNMFNSITVNSAAVVIGDSTQTIIKKINQTVINIPLLINGNLEKTKLEKLIENSHSLINRKGKIKLVIIGESDCHGELSDKYSLGRANFIHNSLIEKGISANILTTKIVVCSAFSSLEDSSKLNVTFKIIKP